MIDITEERLLTLSQAARQLAPSRPVHISTIYRWADRGVRGERLEAVRVGGRTLTSAEALLRFVRRLNPEPGAVPEPPNPRAQWASDELAERGC